MGTYCMYLRKSRADLEAEARGEGETLKKHRTTLFSLAKKMNINISEVYSEIVSGERILERPVVQQVLSEVEDGKWTGVLVMEVERLARGDTMDQGLVAQSFKYSSTKIITPMKVYDPNNEFDEEYFEFGLFMSRREYKTINRRLQGGRIASVKEGNFIGNKAPYGYKRVRLSDGSHSLVIDEEKAKVVRLIFDMYTNQNMGFATISKKLNLLGVPTATGANWVTATLKKMITCDTYAGKVSWYKRKSKSVRKDGILVKSRPYGPKDEWIVAEGKHEAIITEETFKKAQKIISERTHPSAPRGVLKSSLAGLIRCDMCGKMMVRRPHTNGRPAAFICQNNMCSNISSVFTVVENKVLEGLRLWVEQSKNEWSEHIPKNDQSIESNIQAKQQLVKGLEKKLNDLKQQSGNLHDLLERGIYSVDTFLERNQNLAARTVETELILKHSIADLEIEIKRKKAQSDHIPNVERVLEIYYLTDDPAERNSLLKLVLEFATYRKQKRAHWTNPGDENKFDLVLYPKLPQI